MMNRLTKLTIALAASILVAGSAQASLYTVGSTIEVTNVSAGAGKGVSITATGLGTHNVHAGVIKLTIDGSVVDAFCIDPFQWATTGNDFVVANLWTAPLSKPMGASDAELLGKLWDKYFVSALTNNSVAAILQVAIWKTVGDGWFQVNNTTMNNLAQGYIDAANAHSGKASLVALTKVNGQDFVVRQVPDGGATLLLLGLGLSGLAFLRRRL